MPRYFATVFFFNNKIVLTKRNLHGTMPTINAHMIVTGKIDSAQERSVGEARSTICEGCDSEHRKVSVHNPKVPPTEAKNQQVVLQICLHYRSMKVTLVSNNNTTER